jgi:hypothetical protein
VTKCLNAWLLGTNLGSASTVGLRSYNLWFEPRLTPHRTRRKCKGLAAHRHSKTALRIHHHCNRRLFGHFARAPPHGLGRGDSSGDTVVTFLERADNATAMYVAAETLGLPAANLPRNTRSEMSLRIRFGGMGAGNLVALADAAHVEAASLAVGSAIHFLTMQDARVRGDSNSSLHSPMLRYYFCFPSRFPCRRAHVVHFVIYVSNHAFKTCTYV